MTRSTGDAPQVSGVWAWRVWLGAALLFTCEVLLWRDVAGHSAGTWLALAGGYVLVASLALDLVVRYRIRDAVGFMALAVIVSALVALLLTPHSTLTVMPEHLFSRVLGAYGVMALSAFGLLALMWGGAAGRLRWVALAYATAGGLLVGVWAHSAHELSAWSATAATLEGLIGWNLAGGAGLAVGGAGLARRERPAAEALCFAGRGWAIIGLLIALIVFAGIATERYQGAELTGAGGLALVGWLALWFEHNAKSRPIFDRMRPRIPPAASYMALLLLLYGGGLWAGWHVPVDTVDGLPPVTVLELGFVALGFGWLPVLSVWIAARALERESRKINPF
ncbi:MAG: hypothetical protein EA396_01570 [Anaerolineaceae bacterium]|nr:MAG: hypothetical protein EA396_01570 [Anaerolineaceae bacterium]